MRENKLTILNDINPSSHQVRFKMELFYNGEEHARIETHGWSSQKNF